MRPFISVLSMPCLLRACSAEIGELAGEHTSGIANGDHVRRECVASTVELRGRTRRVTTHHGWIVSTPEVPLLKRRGHAHESTFATAEARLRERSPDAFA
jgi:hypothetical protein